MEQLHKRSKITKESVIDDITSSIRDISTSVTSISESYRTLLKANKAVVLYCQSIEKRQRETTLDKLQTDLEQTRIEQK